MLIAWRCSLCQVIFPLGREGGGAFLNTLPLSSRLGKWTRVLRFQLLEACCFHILRIWTVTSLGRFLFSMSISNSFPLY